MDPKDKRMIVVGAGLVGALWTVFLAKRGYQVDVYERRSDMRKKGFVGGRSINLALSDRGWKALRLAGVEDKIRESAIPLKGRMMHSVDGQLTFQPYGKKDQAIYSVSRGGLNLELIRIAEQFENVRFHFDHKCTGLDLKTRNLHFKKLPEREERIADAPYIFATDGAFSAVRASLQRTPRFNYSQEYLDHGYKELSIPPGPGGTHLIDKNALHIWPRKSFMLIALPNTDGSFTCTLFLPFEGADAFENLQTPGEVMQFFNKYFPDVIPLMPDLLEDFQNNPTAPLVTIRCSPWSYQDHVILMGDAAHAIVPFYGQGMNSGFEDCTILSHLADDLNDDWEKVIQSFNKSRILDADAIADLALRNFIEMRDQVADADFLLRKKIAGWLHEKYPLEFIPMYSMVTFSHVPYSEALKESLAQDQLFARILGIKGVHDNWQSLEVEQVFRDWLKSKSDLS